MGGWFASSGFSATWVIFHPPIKARNKDTMQPKITEYFKKLFLKGDIEEPNESILKAHVIGSITFIIEDVKNDLIIVNIALSDDNGEIIFDYGNYEVRKGNTITLDKIKMIQDFTLTAG
jgi:hypothetical protein